MAERGARCGQAVSTRVDALVSTLAPLDPDDWRRRCDGEGWPLGLVAAHVGLGLHRQAGWIEAQLRGRAPHMFSWDETNELNAENARRRGIVAKPEVIRFLGERAGQIAALASRLTDAQLDAIVFVHQEKGRTAEWVLSVLACRHIDEHHRSIRATLGLP